MVLPDFKEMLSFLPYKLVCALKACLQRNNREVYLVGGTVRDFMLERASMDVDVTVPNSAVSFCKELIEALGSGTFVSLAGRNDEDAGRVVWQGFTIDISSFREGTTSIDQDLAKRDFTLNGMAVDLCGLLRKEAVILIDPLNGQDALLNRRLDSCENAFVDDPLRILRGFRLAATHGFCLTNKTIEKIIENKEQIKGVSHERIQHELDLILETPNAHRQIAALADCGVLFEIFPELKLGVGVEQPDFHHLDVFSHNLEALKFVEQIINNPENYYSSFLGEIREYLQVKNVSRQLKWAALFHDLGKPDARGVSETKDNRTTFHNHDLLGEEIFQKIAVRLRWSNDDTNVVSKLISLHMHPFHLSNLLRESTLSKRAVARLGRRAGEMLVGLFLLAMSDSMASQGRLKPTNMEQELDELFGKVYQIYKESVQPVLSNPKLLNGNDLIHEFGLKPGPKFKEILTELDYAVIDGKINDRGEALSWVKTFIEK